MRTLLLLIILSTPALAEEPIPAEKWNDVRNILTPEEMKSPQAAEIFIAKVKHDNALRRQQATQKRMEVK